MGRLRDMFSKDDPTRLFLDEIVSVGMVSAGANPDSELLLFKSADPVSGDNPGSPPQGGEDRKETNMPDDTPVAEATEEVAADVVSEDTPTEEVAEEVTEEVVAEDRSEELVGAAKSQDVLKSADPAIQALVAKAQADAEEAKAQAEALAKRLDASEETLTAERYVRKASSEYATLGKAEDIGPHLRAIDGLPQGTREWLGELLKSHQAMVETSDLFKAIGSSDHGGSEGSAEGQAQSKATELMKSETGLTREQAYDRVLAEDSELATRVMAEDRDNRKAAATRGVNS